MEKLYDEMMKEQFFWFGGMSCLFGIIYTFCTYDNIAGITFPIIVAVTLYFSSLFLNRAGIKLKKYTFLYYLGIMLLGISTCLTTNIFFHFFNRVGIVILFFTVMMQEINPSDRENLYSYVKKIFKLIGNCIISLATPFKHFSYFLSKEKEGRKKKIAAVLVGAAFSIIFLLIVLPLLINSDYIFANYFKNFFKYINVGFILGITFTFLAGYILFYAFFSALLCKEIKENKKDENKKVNAITGITFTAILSFFYLIYSAIQILHLFLRVGFKLPEGVTYSQYAHSGFWQLLIVSVINIITILICTYIFEENLILKIFMILISVCTYIMAASSAYRMFLYIRAYDLTFLRVIVLWFIAVLILILTGMIISILKKRFPLLQYITIVISVCYILISFIGVDKMVAAYNIKYANENNWDIYYLMYQTSEDAVPYIEKFVETHYESFDDDLKNEVNQYFNNIKEKNFSLRKWNYAEAKAKAAAEKFSKKFND